MSDNTQDLSKFGFREIGLAADLLAAWSDNKTVEDLSLYDDVHIEFNPNSGYVFLVDEEFNVVMLNGDGKLENWESCDICGNEGFRSLMELDDDMHCGECQKKNN